jgi:transposase
MTMNRVEVVTSVERRRRWSAAEKARLVAAMVEPGVVVTEVARSAGLDASLLYRWRRELGGARKTLTFVPVRVTPEVSEACSESAPVCAPQSPSSPAPSPARSSITIAFGERVLMTIEGAPDAATLANVIGALAAPDRRR